MENLKINIIENNTLYHFRLTDLLTIITKSLLNYEEVGLIKPLMPKNPYTNIEFSKSNLYNIFYKTCESPILVPLLFHKFYLKHFDVREFTVENDSYLIYNSVVNYIDNSSDYDLYIDVLNFLEKSKRKLTFINIERLLRTIPISVIIKELKPAIKLYYLTKYSTSVMRRRDSELKIEKFLVSFNLKFKNREERVVRRYFTSARRNLFGNNNNRFVQNSHSESEGSDMSIDNEEDENEDEESKDEDESKEESKEETSEGQESKDDEEVDLDDEDGITVEVGISEFVSSVQENESDNSNEDGHENKDEDEDEENRISSEEISDSNIILSRSILENADTDISGNNLSPTAIAVTNFVNNLINENINEIIGGTTNVVEPDAQPVAEPVAEPTSVSRPLSLSPMPTADLFRYVPSPRRGRLRRSRRSPRTRTRSRITSPNGFMNRGQTSEGVSFSTEVRQSPLTSVGGLNRTPTPRPVQNSFTPFPFLDLSNNFV